ncbi:hypothetical protein STBA_08080 [Streptomyces sp. MP131-18]|nr:hypothetical protein STBA_08080 [Streptomyces sp. MP131-18]
MPYSATRCRATSAPSVPVPPVISTVPAGSGVRGVVSTIFPTCRAWLMNRNASAARRMSQVTVGSGVSLSSR